MAGNSTSSANSWTERSASTDPSAGVINFFEKLINTEGTDVRDSRDQRAGAAEGTGRTVRCERGPGRWTVVHRGQSADRADHAGRRHHGISLTEQGCTAANDHQCSASSR